MNAHVDGSARNAQRYGDSAAEPADGGKIDDDDDDTRW